LCSGPAIDNGPFDMTSTCSPLERGRAATGTTVRPSSYDQLVCSLPSTMTRSGRFVCSRRMVYRRIPSPSFGSTVTAHLSGAGDSVENLVHENSPWMKPLLTPSS
jgi:hypothetical protein